MKFNRLESFLRDKNKVSRYRAALGVLYELNIDALLIESFIPQETIEGAEILSANALHNQRAVGFRECLNRLFMLDQLNVPEDDRVVRDYGAIDRMINDGLIKEEDRDKLLEGIV